MRKKFLILVILFVLLITVGCSRLNKSVKLDENTNIAENIDENESVAQARSSLEKYIKAINEKDEKTINELIDEHTVSPLADSNISKMDILDIKYNEKFNSDDTPKDKYVAFDIKYEVLYQNGNKATENKWISLDKINDNWIIRSVGKS